MQGAELRRLLVQEAVPVRVRAAQRTPGEALTQRLVPARAQPQVARPQQERGEELLAVRRMPEAERAEQLRQEREVARLAVLLVLRVALLEERMPAVEQPGPAARRMPVAARLADQAQEAAVPPLRERRER